MQTLILKPGKERSLLRRHPWIFANAIDRVEGRQVSGATFVVRSHSGQFLARAAFSPVSQIRARVWSFDEAEPIDHAFFKRRIAAAAAYRRAWVHDTDAVPNNWRYYRYRVYERVIPLRNMIWGNFE